MRFAPGANDVERELRVMGSSVLEALRPFVIEFVADLQRARTGEHFTDLERRLLEQFLRHQGTQQRTRQRLVELKQRRSTLTSAKPVDVPAVRVLSDDIATDELFDHVLGCALHVLRCLGDGIAWTILNFDRCAITVLGDGRRVGRLADGTGLEAELAMLDRETVRRTVCEAGATC